ncbi:MAG: hypothetical protein E3J64_05550 [Anaerolineales bacterium]|nr:MAG: hypothetical protein E3J64_05550 [Anaerolineales bacterium]
MRRVGTLAVTGVLLDLIAVLGVFLVVATDLPGQVLNSRQVTYLGLMEERSASRRRGRACAWGDRTVG